MPPLTDKPSPGVEARPGREYWRSLEHLADTPEFREFMHREFPAGASELLASDRRHFLKIMGASMALAGLGLAGCRRWPEQEIAPYASRPVGHVPGLPELYASCREQGGVAQAVLVTAFDGRPTKIEGNPDDATSRGAADIFTQASVLDLYDPDRSRSPREDDEPRTRHEFEAWARDHFGTLAGKKGKGLAVLSQASSSPSQADMRRRLEQVMPEMKWFEYEPLINDEVVRGSEMAFGRAYRTLLDLEHARTIVCLDADPLGPHPGAVANIRGFARSRTPRKDAGGLAMSRLYAFESDMSLTGANADVRVGVRSADIAAAAAYLASHLLDGDAALGAAAEAAGLSAEVRADLDRAVADLGSSGGAAVVVAGDRQPAAVHALVHLINEKIGAAAGAKPVVRYVPAEGAVAQAESIGKLVDMMARFKTLVILGGNPVYDAPADLDFAAKLAKVKTSIHLSDHFDETSASCTWHVNRAHFLESWGDGRTWDGTYAICQPLIEPLFDGCSAVEMLALMAGEAMTARDVVRRTFFEMIGREDEKAWRQTLHDGVLAGSALTVETPRSSGTALADAAKALGTPAAGGWELVFAADPTVYDGRFANNGWMQEVPGPITKLTWDNAVVVGTASAAELDVETGDRVEVAAGGNAVEAAVMVLPGVAAHSAILTLGYGRAFLGRISAGAGFDFNPLRTVAAMGFVTEATVTKKPGSYKLATTQDHHTIDVDTTGGRGVQQRLGSLFREADLDEFERDPSFAAHRTHVVHRLSMWEEDNLAGANYRWAMSVDLNKCVGCGACIAACQAENNIPIVGKDQVTRGREMHWMRVDRYFAFDRTDGAYDNTRVQSVALQPVLCMQCENAPCEQVCPVAATVHDEDGLNVMVYNRCIGTRYCSNNCPYKVRRFNYFDYWRREPKREQRGLLQVDAGYYTKKQAMPHAIGGEEDELRPLQFNPEVTVRNRGVMEKCTYCVQRIINGRIEAKNAFAALPAKEKERRADDRIAVEDGAITPACAQTCPAEALVFGDLNDRDSRIAKLHADPRSYQMLEELNVDARTRYMARLRNPAVPRDTGNGHGHGGDGGHGDEQH